jgi:RNA ligase (TIGR02306 family)
MSEIVRKLASIQRVIALDPIEGADRIEVASVLGWKIVVQKGLYQVGDLVVFFEIDSFLPVAPAYEFLRKSSYRVTKDLGEGFRIKTCKLRGQISQGLLFPIAELEGLRHQPREEGDDVTELLGVRKWEPNAQVLLSGAAAGNFPSYIPKTDEPRVQNLTREKQAWSEDTFVPTIKEDGSSMTVFVGFDDVDDGNIWRVGVCSRNWEVKDEDNNTYWKVARDIGLVAALQQMGIGVAIQGELVGPGIQKNPAGYDKLHFKVFNIWLIGESRYATPAERHAMIVSINTLFKTNIEEVETLSGLVAGIANESTLDVFIKQANTLTGQEVEGIVFKSVQHPECSYKYINPNYLLKDKD